MIALKAEGDFEIALKKYLDTNITEALTEKINAGAKTLTQCANFIISEMRKKAKGSCHVATDEEVYGLAVHFFEEDAIQGSNVATGMVKSKPVDEPKHEAKPDKKKDMKDFQLEGQMSIFDL